MFSLETYQSASPVVLGVLITLLVASGVAVQSAASVGTELVVAEVHRGRELGELGDVEVFGRHADCLAGRVVWIEV